MVRKAFTLEALPASYGDSLLLTFTTVKGPWRLLVDTGPDETYSSLRNRLLQIPLNRKGRRRIDLFIVFFGYRRAKLFCEQQLAAAQHHFRARRLAGRQHET